MKNAVVLTLGCKTNQYEGEVLGRRLVGMGYRLSADGVECDLAVVNTCTVTVRADRKCRQLIRQIARRHPGVPIYVTGCYVTRRASDLTGLEGVAGAADDKDDLLDLIARNEQVTPLAPVARPPVGREPLSCQAVEDSPRGGAPVPPRVSGQRPGGTGAPPGAEHLLRCDPGRRTRAYLKIQDGCDAFCSYCIVPYVRPTLHSEPVDDLLAEARELVDAGYCEIVLTGIHLGRYGADRDDGVTLTDVVRRVAETPGLARLRLSSIEQPELPDELIELIASHPVLCPHLHLPLQSGDDDVLEAMNRRYTADDFLRTIERVRERIGDASVTTDVIAGFPGETDAAFENTLAVCRQAGFSKMHVFPFSVRPGTSAATLPGRLTARVVTRRKKHLLALADELALDYKQRFLGRTVEVLVERSAPDASGGLISEGLTAYYMRVRFAGRDALVNRIVPVTVEHVTPGLMEARLSD